MVGVLAICKRFPLQLLLTDKPAAELPTNNPQPFSGAPGVN